MCAAPRQALAWFLVCSLVFPLRAGPAHAALEERPDASEAYTAPDVTTGTVAATAETTGAEARKSRDIPVSARGTFSTSVAIDVPPGRAGMQPGLALTYDSGAARRDSAVGIGWALS